MHENQRATPGKEEQSTKFDSPRAAKSGLTINLEEAKKNGNLGQTLNERDTELWNQETHSLI